MISKSIFGALMGILTVLEPWWVKTFERNYTSAPRVAQDSYPSKFQKSVPDLMELKKDSVLLYRGIALLDSGKVEQAVSVLEQAAARVSHSVSNNSEWYLALSYLKLGRLEEAEYMFLWVAEKEVHPYQNEAEIVYQMFLGMRE